MKCQSLMTRPLGLALLLIVAVMPGAFAQSELKRPPTTGTESSDLANPARDLEASRNLSFSTSLTIFRKFMLQSTHSLCAEQKPDCDTAPT